MTIAFRAAASGSTTPGTSATATIPSSVQANDTVFLFGASIGLTGSSVVFTNAGPTSPSSIRNVLTSNFTPTAYVYAVWYFTAAAGDASSVVTMKNNDNGSSYMSLIICAYSGAAASQPDVITNHDTTTTVTSSFTAPTAVTGVSGDWGINYAFAAGGNVNITANPGTLRQSPASYSHAVSDSNGTVGSAGTTIGGGTWSASSTDTWAGFTIGLQPPASAATAVPYMISQNTGFF